MHKIFKRSCCTIVLPIKSIVLPCPRCRRRRGLLKVPNKQTTTATASRTWRNKQEKMGRTIV